MLGPFAARKPACGHKRLDHAGGRHVTWKDRNEVKQPRGARPDVPDAGVIPDLLLSSRSTALADAAVHASAAQALDVGAPPLVYIIPF